MEKITIIREVQRHRSVKDQILASIPPYTAIAEHKDLMSFCIDADFLTDEEFPDFNELVVIVEKDWLFDIMGVENPRVYLQEDYNSYDSIKWFEQGIKDEKIVMVNFN